MAKRSNGKVRDRHGEAKRKTPEYRAWQDMIRRCYDKSRPSFRNYGGRGITVHPAWRASYSAFLESMGRRPSPGHSLDRIDNDGNYCPSNCRWATHVEQNRNRRNNREFTALGKTQCLAAWAQEVGIHAQTLRSRLTRPDIEIVAALTKPVKRYSPPGFFHAHLQKTLRTGGKP